MTGYMLESKKKLINIFCVVNLCENVGVFSFHLTA